MGKKASNPPGPGHKPSPPPAPPVRPPTSDGQRPYLRVAPAPLAAVGVTAEYCCPYFPPEKDWCYSSEDGSIWAAEWTPAQLRAVAADMERRTG